MSTVYRHPMEVYPYSVGADPNLHLRIDERVKPYQQALLRWLEANGINGRNVKAPVKVLGNYLVFQEFVRDRNGRGIINEARTGLVKRKRRVRQVVGFAEANR